MREYSHNNIPVAQSQTEPPVQFDWTRQNTPRPQHWPNPWKTTQTKLCIIHKETNPQITSSPPHLPQITSSPFPWITSSPLTPSPSPWPSSPDHQSSWTPRTAQPGPWLDPLLSQSYQYLKGRKHRQLLCCALINAHLQVLQELHWGSNETLQ